MLFVVALFATVGGTHLGGMRWDFDEGVHAMEAYLWLRAMPLYEEVFSSDMPLFVASIAGAFSLFGPSIQAARAVTLFYSSVGLLAVGLTTSALASRWAGLVAVVCLAITPDFFLYSRVCMEDVPAFSTAAVSILLLILYCRSGKPWGLPLAGATFGAGILLKLVPVAIAPVPLAIIVWQCRQRGFSVGRILWALFLFGFFAALPTLACLAMFDPGQMFRQVALYPARGAHAFAGTRAKNVLDILRFMALDNIGMTMLAVYAVWTASMKKRWPLWPALAWLAILAPALLLHAPLWPHLLTGLLFPMAMLAGQGMIDVVTDLRVADIGHSERKAAWLVLGVVILNVMVAFVVDFGQLNAPTSNAMLHAIGTLESRTTLDSLVLTDEPIVPFLAGRRVPGQLTDTSFKRIKSGTLTAAQVIQVAENQFPEAAFLGSDERFGLMPELIEWIEMHYATEYRYQDGSRLFFDPL